MRKIIILMLGWGAWTWAAVAHDCAKHLTIDLTRPDPVVLEAELNLVRKFRPFVMTYPFTNQKGQEVLVVFGDKFPLSKDFPIMEIPTPQGLKERWQNFTKTWTPYYYLSKNELTRLTLAKDGAALSTDFARINDARVILLPFIKFPRINAEDLYLSAGKELALLHQSHLRTVIEALHKIGFHSALGGLLKDWYGLLQLTDKTSGQEYWINELTREGEDRLHNVYGAGIMRMIHQSFKTRDGRTKVWSNKTSYKYPKFYLRDEKVRKFLKDNHGFFSRALENADRLMEKRKELEQQGYSEEEIDKILYTRKQRDFRKRLKELLKSKDLFRNDNP